MTRSINSPRGYRVWLWPAGPRPGRVGRWLGLQTARLLGLTLVVAVLGGLAFRDRLIFHPVAGPDRATPRNYSLNYEEFWLTTAAGDRVRVWRLPPPGGAPGRTALFFQGNSGNLSLILNHLTFLNSLGLNVLAVDYPGYGPSPGRPGEEAVYQSAEALWQWAVRNGAAPEDLLIYGFSLGGGTAAWLARAHPPAALVLDSTFTRLRDVPGYGRPWLIPYLKLILGSAFDTRARLAEISGPLLVLHSPGDDVVPFALGRELFQAYQNNVKYFGLSHGGHMDFLLNLALYREKLQALLAAADRKNQVSADQPLHGRGLRGKDRPGRG